MQAKIKNIQNERHQAKNINFLKVEFDIIENDIILESKNIGMDISSTKDEIIEEINKHITQYGKEIENEKVDEKRESDNKNIKEIKETLIGETITINNI